MKKAFFLSLLFVIFLAGKKNYCKVRPYFLTDTFRMAVKGETGRFLFIIEKSF